MIYHEFIVYTNIWNHLIMEIKLVFIYCILDHHPENYPSVKRLAGLSLQGFSAVVVFRNGCSPW